MEEIIEEEKKPSQKTRIPLFVAATIAILIVAYISVFIWSINFKEIVDSAKGEDMGTAFAAIFAVILLSLPFLGGCLLIVLITAPFVPLSFGMLTKSSSKPISIIGYVYGGLFAASLIATIIRVVLYAVAIA